VHGPVLPVGDGSEVGLATDKEKNSCRNSWSNFERSSTNCAVVGGGTGRSGGRLQLHKKKKDALEYANERVVKMLL